MTEQRKSGRPESDPVRAGAEAVAAGYRTVEAVFDAFAESLRRRPRSGSPMAARMGPKTAAEEREEGPGKGRGGGTPRGVTEVTAELFDLLGERMRGLGAGIGGVGESRPETPTVVLKKPAEADGEAADGSWKAEQAFWFTNTGAAVLGKVQFKATDLVGPEDSISADNVEFKHLNPEPGPLVQPGRSIQVTATVTVPGGKPAGAYRGVISPEPATPEPGATAGPGVAPRDAWAVLEVEVPEAEAEPA